MSFFNPKTEGVRSAGNRREKIDALIWTTIIALCGFGAYSVVRAIVGLLTG